MSRLSRLLGGGLAVLLYCAFLLAFFAAPLGLLVAQSLTSKTGAFTLAHYREYLGSPDLLLSIGNTLFLGAGTVVFTVPLAFAFAYGIERSRIPFRGLFGILGSVPLLAPSLLPAIALVYLFGEQGILTPLFGGHTIYGSPGLLVAETIAAFPHAFVILRTALSASDGRLYEQARILGAGRARTFFSLTLPSARHGLVSASFVVFSLAIADVGAPKVVGGDFDVLALEIYKQVLGLQNFNLGAVVAVMLLVPTAVAVVFERWAARKQAALRTSRSTAYRPDANLGRDAAMLLVCTLTGAAIVGILVVCQIAAVVKLWPYDLSWTLDHYRFDDFDGGGWAAVTDSAWLACATAALGTTLVFGGAYISEKLRTLKILRGLYSILALAPAAVPGLALGLAYALFFNDPANPLHVIYDTVWVLLIANVVHYFTVPHLTSISAVKALDPEYEAAAAISGRSMLSVFGRVAMPLSAASLADIALYLFINAMTTVSVVVFLYPPDFKLASVAVLNMDDAGDAAPAAAMGMMIVYINLAARLIGAAVMRYLQSRKLARETERVELAAT
ncbi:MAG TPA: putative 2-aminoethylphosphonate ABC transporter permease subunit [Rhizomicrobium sp.]|nr:putative 2-aminoethylphosphonate ABC transporter permease subunit [Rhizomicrobium sp.]